MVKVLGPVHAWCKCIEVKAVSMPLKSPKPCDREHLTALPPRDHARVWQVVFFLGLSFSRYSFAVWEVCPFSDSGHTLESTLFRIHMQSPILWKPSEVSKSFRKSPLGWDLKIWALAPSGSSPTRFLHQEIDFCHCPLLRASAGAWVHPLNQAPIQGPIIDS